MLVLCLSLALAQQPNFELAGDASPNGSTIRLTSAQPNQTGAAWLSTPQPIAQSFTAEFTFQILKPPKNSTIGADGFAFVIQNVGPGVIGGRGSSGGFSIGRGSNPPTQGIPRSLAVFFDTHENQEENDPSSNSVAIFTNGDGKFPPRRLALLWNAPVRLKDGRPHKVRIEYQRPLFEVTLDDRRILTANVSLDAIIGSTGQGYLGFTASTGGGFQTHDILDFQLQSGPQSSIQYESVSSTLKFHKEACLPGRTLCTPPQAIVDQPSEGRWHVIIPAHLPNPISIPNPGNARPSITNLSGTICWHHNKANRYWCHGPEGNGSGRGKLTQQMRAGQRLISIDIDPTTADQNEGYFEFDLTLTAK